MTQKSEKEMVRMERKENRFAFRASNELGDFLRLMSKQTGWDSSEVVRFGLGYWMMHVKTGIFKAFGDSQYAPLLRKINITSRDIIPEGDIKSLMNLSDKYVQALDSSLDGVEPHVTPSDVEAMTSEPAPANPSEPETPPAEPTPEPEPEPEKKKPKKRKSGKRKTGKKRGKKGK